MRAALAACLALTPAVAAASIAGVLVQRHQLTAGVTVTAEEQARAVAASLPAPRSADASAFRASVGGEANLVQVIDDHGNVVAATPALQGLAPLIDQRELHDGAHRTMTGLQSGELDEYVVVAASDGDGEYVIAAQSLEGVDAAIDSTLGLLAIGIPVLVVLVGALSYRLAGRALQPVERLRAEAAEITSADRSAHLPHLATGDEIERLAVTLNEMLARLQASAESQRRFVADASHELRSPIATIRTLHEVAAATESSEDDALLSREVLAEVARLEDLVTDLLLLARLDGHPRTPVETVDLSAVVHAEAQRARGVPVTTAITDDLLVRGDQDSLARSVRNVLDNAARYATSRVEMTLDATHARAVLTIRDDGPGIRPVDRERIFDRFVRLDDSRARDAGGNGLGLAICRRLLDQNGGTVRVVDPADGSHGSVFRIEIPLLSPQARRPTP